MSSELLETVYSIGTVSNIFKKYCWSSRANRYRDVAMELKHHHNKKNDVL